MKTILPIVLLFFTMFINVLTAQPANNDCTNAESITINTTNTTNMIYDTTLATESMDGSCETNHVFLDVWYEFIMPVNGNIHITNADGFDYFTIYDTCGGTEIACGNDNSFFYNLSSGITYTLRISNRDIFAGNKSVDIIAIENSVNNDCISPESISINTTAPTTIAYNTINATESVDASCETNHVFHDLWYEFTMPIDGNIRITEADIFDYIAIYDDCAGTEIDCRNDNGFLYNLIANTTYKLRIANRTDFTEAKSLDIIAAEVAINDTCANPEIISIDTATPTTIAYNTINATESIDASCESNHIFHDLWYEFTMPVNGNISITDADVFDFFTLYDTCNGTELFCDENNTTVPSLTSGTTYKLRVANRTNFADIKSFDIRASPIAVNDTCTDAIPITISETALNLDFEILGASINNEQGCTITDNYGDIWYSFTMPQDGNVSVDADITWNKFALYESCGATQLNCFEGSGTFTNLTLGTTYYMRLFRTDDDLQVLNFTTFSIQIESTLETIHFEKETFRVSPNPASSQVKITGINSIRSIQLFDMLGKKLVETKNTSTLKVNSFKPGIYLLKISSQSGNFVKRFVID